ncbi:hypothetical protein Q4I30_003632 [Leishmania utingensis]|uniref:Uncharacterized protein n=1 Tax=Leishmania utingensis TaxID=653362 RepID=A0AAW3AMG3_9TRYP
MDMEDKRKETRAKIKTAKDPLEGYKTKVESAILAHQMSPIVAATATILLGLSGPESQELNANERIAEWLSIFVDETCSSRLLAYNVQVAESVAGGMRQWRKVLKRLDAPLVPETERLAHLNRITLEAAENEKQRGTQHAHVIYFGHLQETAAIPWKAARRTHPFLEQMARKSPPWI